VFLLIYLSILIVLIFVWLCVGGYVFFTACKRTKENPWLDKQAMEKTIYGKYADSILEADLWIKNHAHEDVCTDSHDGLKLYATWIPAQNPKGSILLAHGYKSCKLLDFGVAFELYHSLGLNILAIDQRSHGRSEGKYITFGVLESRDVETWIRFFNEKLGGGDLILSGLSMGASTVMYTADRCLPDNVKGRIADCGFTSPAQIIAKVFRDTVHFPPGPFLWSAELFARICEHFSLYERDSRKTLSQNSLPIILVHGMDDDFVPCKMTRQGYASCGGDKKLLLIKGAGHGTSFLVEPEQYTQLIKDFLGRTLDALRGTEKL